MAVTFEPHPTRILRPEAGLKLLTPTPEKLRWLEGTGIDAVLLLPFGRDLSLMTPRQFAERILKKKLHAREVHEGFNFRFGHKAAGDMNMLAEFGREMGFEVKVYPEMTLRGEDGFEQPDSPAARRGAREPGAASAGASVLHSGDAGARARLRIEIHGADHQPGALRRTCAEGRRLHHLDARRGPNALTRSRMWAIVRRSERNYLPLKPTC